MTESSSDSQVTLKIPRPLYLQLKQVIQGSGFHSVTEFAVYVLRDLISNHDRSGGVLTRRRYGLADAPAWPHGRQCRCCGNGDS
jgi:hypothetical protein